MAKLSVFKHFKQLLEKELEAMPNNENALVYLDLVVGYVEILEQRMTVHDTELKRAQTESQTSEK